MLLEKEIQKVWRELHTLGEWIQFIASQFTQANLYFGHGTDNAQDEAIQLLISALDIPLDFDEEYLQVRQLNDEEKQLVTQIMIERITTRKPLAYITHQAWFNGLPFFVDERVLVPRSPMAEWINRQFQPWVDPQQVKHILDVGTGSGSLAICLALAFPDAMIDAVDLSADALEVADFNIKDYQLQEQISLHQSDCFSALTAKKYDIIVSNPPYVSAEEWAELPAEYHHEPRSALVAEEEGMVIVANIMHHAGKFLSPHGILVIEVGYSDEQLLQRFPTVPFTWLDLEMGGQGVFLLTAEQLR